MLEDWKRAQANSHRPSGQRPERRAPRSGSLTPVVSLSSGTGVISGIKIPVSPSCSKPYASTSSLERRLPHDTNPGHSHTV